MWINDITQQTEWLQSIIIQANELTKSTREDVNNIVAKNRFLDIPFNEYSVEDIALACSHFWLHLKEFESLILKSGNINVKDREGNTALIWAAHWGNLNLARMLLSRPEILVNEKADDGSTALILASKGGSYKIVKLLLSRPEILVNEKGTPRRFTALRWAIENFRYSYTVDVIKVLLSDPRLILDKYDQEEVIKKNIINRLEVSELYEGVNQHLFEGVMSWDIELIQKAIRDGADVNSIDRNWDSMFNYAIYMHNLEKATCIMEVFLKNWFSKINHIDVDGNSILLNAVYRPDIEDEMGILLIQYWADKNILLRNNKTLLDLAKENWRLKLVKFLLTL